jgi:type IX secretion system PorP/SprF family membrane protein
MNSFKKSNITKQVITLCFILLARFGFSQQDPSFSQFMYNGLTINPAMAGSSKTVSALAISRQQWAGIKGAPSTQTFNVDAPWGKKVGLALSVINDQVGITKNLNISGQYSYQLQFEHSTLSFGLQASVNNYRADYTSVVTNPIVPDQNVADNSFNENINQMGFNFGTGAYYYSQNFYAGVSVPHILNQRLDGFHGDNSSLTKQMRHYFLTAGYIFDVGMKVKIKPSALLKIVEGSPVQLDLNTTLWYDDLVGIGVSYRTNDSVTGLFQYQIGKQFRVGYARDFIVSSLSRYTTGNNEIMVRFDLRKKSDDKVVNRVRYYN